MYGLIEKNSKYLQTSTLHPLHVFNFPGMMRFRRCPLPHFLLSFPQVRLPLKNWSSETSQSHGTLTFQKSPKESKTSYEAVNHIQSIKKRLFRPVKAHEMPFIEFCDAQEDPDCQAFFLKG